MYFAKNSNNALAQKARRKNIKKSVVVVEEKRILSNAKPRKEKQVSSDLGKTSDKIDEVVRRVKALSDEKKKLEEKEKKVEAENKKLKKEKQEIQADLKKKKVEVKMAEGEKPTNDEKVDLVGGVSGFVSTAVEQLTGTGEFTPDPNNPPDPTLVDQVKDQVVGTGEFDVHQK